MSWVDSFYWAIIFMIVAEIIFAIIITLQGK